MLTAKPRKLLSRLAFLLLAGATAAAGVDCGFGGPAPGQSGTGGSTGTGGSQSGSGGAAGNVTPTGSGGTNVEPSGSGGAAGSATGTGGSGSGGVGMMTGTGGAGGMGGMPGTGGAGPATTFMNYQIHGNWPALKAVVATKPGTLSYTKVTAHTRFLGESCSIADYDKDGMPDISSGRRWFKGPAFTTGYVFRGGHEDLPRAGDGPELVSGVSDDWSDFPFDVDGDSWTDIINIASSDANTGVMPAPMPQRNATGFWYKNPGATAATNMMWQSYLMHGDIRHEQHGFVDVDNDGKPEIFGACRGCNPQQTKGYYKAAASPTAGWTYVPVTGTITFPFGGSGWMHGLGFGDVNGDGKPDLLDRAGVWLQGTPWAPIRVTLYDGNPAGERGGSHMYSFDVDGDKDLDIVSADGAHHWGLSWYEQTTPMTFVKHQFMGTNSPADIAKYGVGFSEPHALQVADMDGDGVPDIITGKMRFAHPIEYNDPDPLGTPVLYVFKTVQNKPPTNGNGGTVTFEPKLVDPTPQTPGVGRQISVGHANTDGIMDICVATKLGLYVFLGK